MLNQFPKVLVACSTNECKAYSLQRWIDNVKSFTYPNFDILVVDTSETDTYIKPYMNQIPVIRIPYYEDQYRRMCEGMEVMRLKFLEGDYKWWFSCESDIIPPSNVIETLLELGGESDWISHAFPLKDVPDVEVDQGIGCSILSRKLAENFTWAGFAETPDGHLWKEVRPQGKYKVMELWAYMKVKHLKE